MKWPPWTPSPLSYGKVGVELGDGFDATEVVFEGDVLVGGVGVFVGEAKTEEHTRHFEGVVHLRDERNRTAFADEHGFFAEALFERSLRFPEDRIVVRGS